MYSTLSIFFFFFVKQKTAYEMRISDWSSDVCSSDLMAETPDDKALLERFRNPATRDAAFNELVLAYQQRVYWHVRRLVISHEDADDLVQEIFIRIWNHLDNFRGDAQL